MIEIIGVFRADRDNGTRDFRTVFSDRISEKSFAPELSSCPENLLVLEVPGSRSDPGPTFVVDGFRIVKCFALEFDEDLPFSLQQSPKLPY